MPVDVPAPEDCELEEVAWAKELQSRGLATSEESRTTWKHFISVRIYTSHLILDLDINVDMFYRSVPKAR